MTKSLIPADDFPKPIKRPRGRNTTLKREAKKQGTEAAAIAYVQMENGDYKYPEGAYRQYKEDGTPDINQREVMRRAGYAAGSVDHFEDYLATSDEFWELVELHRLRRTDPNFRKNQESMLWSEIGGESLRFLYEKVKYSPHSLSITEHIKVLNTILDAGISFKKYGTDEKSRAADLLGDIEDEEKRDKLIGDYEKSLAGELEAITKLKMAHAAADRENE
jgi:hypothetical protein